MIESIPFAPEKPINLITVAMEVADMLGLEYDKKALILAAKKCDDMVYCYMSNDLEIM